MATRVHPTAIVESGAVLGSDVTIGPFSIVERDARVGDRCQLASRVVIKSGTKLGTDNMLAEGVVLGGKPQHLAAGEEMGDLIIGDRNTFRENATVHRGLAAGSPTVLGDDNLIMVNVHVAHDCRLGHHTILANNAMMAGHVWIGDYAYLSGAVGIHQFCRIGAHAMVGGQAHVTKDVPPYVTVDGQTTRIVGLNVIGLRRRGFSAESIRELKAAYRVIYRSGLKWTDVLARLQQQFPEGPAAAFYAFLSKSQRGVLLERRTPANATVPVSAPQDGQIPASSSIDQRPRLAG